MFSPKAEAPLSVRVPSVTDDRPSWMKVGVIAAIGFIAGVVWPRAAGVRLGPALPESAAASPAAAPSAEGSPPGPSERSARAVEAEPPGGSAVAAPAAVVASATTSAAGAEAPASTPASVSVSVGHGAVFACKTSDGESLKGAACGAVPGLDALLLPRLRKLAECPEASAANGLLHLIVHPDFTRGTVGVELGRGQGVSSPEPLLACARADVAGANLSALTHDNVRYSVSYRVTFGTGDAVGASAPSRVDVTPSAAAPRPSRTQEDVASEGTAQVVWEVALVRDAPKTGKVVARLQRGTSVRVGAVKDGWYPVKYGDGFAADGWIYRGALGR
jgi:hypothetical protein